MRSPILAGATCAALLLAAPAHAQRPREGTLTPGVPAPAFTLRDLEGLRTVSLEALRGKPVVLIFGSCT